jgi:hypothetical protein
MVGLSHSYRTWYLQNKFSKAITIVACLFSYDSFTQKCNMHNFCNIIIIVYIRYITYTVSLYFMKILNHCARAYSTTILNWNQKLLLCSSTRIYLFRFIQIFTWFNILIHRKIKCSNHALVFHRARAKILKIITLIKAEPTFLGK